MSPRFKTVYQEIGWNIRQTRLDAGLTQQDLADLTGFSRTLITHIEAAKQEIRISQLAIIAEALGVTPWQLWRCYAIRKDAPAPVGGG